MRRYRGPNGDPRIWFKEGEIDAVMDAELVSAGLVPTVDDPVTELERFVEGHLGTSLDQYAELPADVLGVTEFRPHGRHAISVNRSLTASAVDAEGIAPGLRGRWRATVAHEASHVVLHRVLFEVDQRQGYLFTELPAPGSQLMRCLKRDVGHRAVTSDWREVQANRGMAALLMPRQLFLRLAREELAPRGVAGGVLSADDAYVAPLVACLSDRIGVSRQAVSIRLTTLGFIAAEASLDPPARHA